MDVDPSVQIGLLLGLSYLAWARREQSPHWNTYWRLVRNSTSSPIEVKNAVDVGYYANTGARAGALTPVGRAIMTAVALGVSASGQHLGAAPLTAAKPWWEMYPTIIQSRDLNLAKRVGAGANMCGVADDPTWGLYGQRQRIAGGGAAYCAALHTNGIKAISWFEGFGTAGSCYLAQLKRKTDGSWEKDPRDPELTRIFSSHWSWQNFDGTGETRWVGVQNFFDDEDFARPYTRANPKYACPPMTYPDGRVAAGYIGEAPDPRNSRIFDAGCSKDVLGRVTFEYEANPEVTQLDPKTKLPHGPLTGLLNVGESKAGVPDPGFTPEEWAKLKKTRYASIVMPGKDIACPMWIDYAKVGVKEAVNTGIDGLWVDNYSPWDNFNAFPNSKAFGEWSVATFRDYLKCHFSGDALLLMGVADIGRFDVREHLRGKCKAWGGDPGNLHDPMWGDPRWQDDPVWRAYLIHKRQVGTDNLGKFYREVKRSAAAAGKLDFLVMGNDIPGFSLGWVRGDLDIVSTELSWGWGLTSGPRGFMPPPAGSYVPFYKLAREHARSRFVNVWMYVPKEAEGKENVARVLYYQALAAHALPMPHRPGKHTAGDETVDAEFFKFVSDCAPTFAERQPVEEIGIYYSSSSQLLQMLPGGFKEHRRQPHSFGLWGWGTALGWLQQQYRFVPEWKLIPENLAGLKLLVIPSADVFEPAEVTVLEPWVRNGGLLIVSGECGRRLGEPGNFELATPGLTLATLTGVADSATAPVRQLREFGKGRVLFFKDDPGYAFFQESDFAQRQALLPGFRDSILEIAQNRLTPVIADTAGIPPSVGLTVYQDVPRKRLFIDINNTDLDLAADKVTSTEKITFSVALPPWLDARKVRAQVLSPGVPPTVNLTPAGDRFQLQVSSIALYASVLLTEAPGSLVR